MKDQYIVHLTDGTTQTYSGVLSTSNRDGFICLEGRVGVVIAMFPAKSVSCIVQAEQDPSHDDPLAPLVEDIDLFALRDKAGEVMAKYYKVSLTDETTRVFTSFGGLFDGRLHFSRRDPHLVSSDSFAPSDIKRVETFRETRDWLQAAGV